MGAITREDVTMVDKAQLIKELGIDAYPADQQDEIFEQFTYALGAAMSEGLSEPQMAEFTAIINGEQPVIDRWLGENAPDFRDDPSYQELEIGYREDPEKVPADKVYASIAWVKLNKPDLEQVVARIKDEFRAQLASRTP